MSPVPAGLVVSLKTRDTKIKIDFALLGSDPNKSIPTTVRILAMGRSFPYEFPKDTAQKSLFNELANNIDDWALIKFENLPEGYSCSPIEVKKIEKDNDFVFHTGYPKYITTPLKLSLENLTGDVRLAKYKEWEKEWYNKNKAAFYDLYPLYIAAGYTFQSYTEMLSIYPNLGKLGPGIADKILDHDIYVASTAPVMPGFSGGGAFNKSGKLIGINSMKPFIGLKYMEDGPEHSVSGSNFDFTYGLSFVSSQHIQRQIFKKLSIDEAADIFSCDETN